MALTDKLTAIGNAIRSKTGETELLTLDEMPAAIQGISGGGDIPEEAFTITKDCNCMFYGHNWTWYLNEFGSKIKTENLNSTYQMFMESTVEDISFDLNFDGTQNDLSYMFAYGYSLKDVTGAIRNAQPTTMNGMFQGCQNLRYLPEFIDCDFSHIRRNNYRYGYQNMFNTCNSLRHISPTLLKELYSEVTNSTSAGYQYLFNAFYSLFALDELVGVNPTNSNSTTNMFGSFCLLASRCKDIKFLTDDGEPIEVYWKGQTIDLSQHVGWVLEKSNILNYNSGLTEATQITDDESYQRLKNSVDSWTLLKEYSRYNRASAVRTIESLPDASTGSGNVIKFAGDAGSKTDGGAINTMTEEEIAVATAKGFTISYA